MCGRFTLIIDSKGLIKILRNKYHISNPEAHFDVPRYNIAPSQDVVAVINDGTKYRAGTLKWGFVPYFAKDEKIGYSMINAKSETLSIKPAFKNSFKFKRCVILADGFYEWKKDENKKIPMRIKMKDDNVFPMAGLWSSYKREDGSNLYTCTIITTTPNKLIEPIHSRMPVILTDEEEKIWLDPTITDTNLLNSVLTPYDDKLMEAYSVSTLVNNPRNDVYDCIVES